MTEARTRILVADDERGMRDLVAFALEPMGYEVVAVADGVEALQRLRQRTFDLVILDVHMPRLTGPETFARIRELYPAQNVLIVSSGSDADCTFETQLRQEGITICLFKPFELDELIDAVQRASTADTPPTTGVTS